MSKAPKIFCTFDPAAPNGDKQAVAFYKKRADDAVELLHVMHGKPVAEWQKKVMAEIQKSVKQGRRVVILPPRRMGQSLFDAMVAEMQKKQAERKKP